MIEILTAELSPDCTALKVALEHEGIAFKETLLDNLGPEELGELEQHARMKQTQLRLLGLSQEVEQIMRAPMLRFNDFVLFPWDLLERGFVKASTLAALKRLENPETQPLGV